MRKLLARVSRTSNKRAGYYEAARPARIVQPLALSFFFRTDTRRSGVVEVFFAGTIVKST
jgi:hypothetical protein